MNEKFIKCPFYRSQEKYKVHCEGVDEHSSIHLVFGDPKMKTEYQRDNCSRNYKECRIAQMLYKKYEEEE